MLLMEKKAMIFYMVMKEPIRLKAAMGTIDYLGARATIS
jgi:hypothetical protein